jgi:hypothetical protein
METYNLLDDKAFENEVRRIARELWPQAAYQGKLKIEGLEPDGVFETEDCIHLVEATTSRGQEKARIDIKKLTGLSQKLRQVRPDMAVKCWFITRQEPTGDQRGEAQKYVGQVNILAFSQFQGKLINALDYLAVREKYRFGSVSDPATGGISPKVAYVPLDIKELNSDHLWTTYELRDAIIGGKRFLLLGDYGAGKSMTLRELFFDLAEKYRNHIVSKFPVYLNLRDHHGQSNPAEIFIRHATNIGFANPEHLIRAWRAGYVFLLIDGIDEITSFGIQGIWKRLRDVRFKALQGVRELLKQTPIDCGLILASRAHFFDGNTERRSALAMGSGYTELSLNDFSDEQIQRYLKSAGLMGAIPKWLPSRPLLLGYLAAKGILEDMMAAPGTSQEGLPADPATGWTHLWDKVCQREADIEAGIDGPTVRRVLERLATTARTGRDGLGPLSRDDLVTSFEQICGYAPDEMGLLLLQRLPGLGATQGDNTSRSFVDEDLSDVLRAGDVVQFLMEPFTFDCHLFDTASVTLGTLGCQVAGHVLSDFSSGKLEAAISRILKSSSSTVLLCDVVRLAMELDCATAVPVTVQHALVTFISLEKQNADFSNVHFRDCFFGGIELGDVDPTRAPRFEGCYVGELSGRRSREDLPTGMFDAACEFDRFQDPGETNSALLRLEVPLGVRVLLTMLRKLYQQSGSGRREMAFHRGLDHAARRLVPTILDILRREGLALRYRKFEDVIWHPDRSQMTRVGRIIASPRECNDPIVAEVADIVT